MSGASDRAIYYTPEKAFSREAPPIVTRLFLDERDAAYSPHAETGCIPLDQSGRLATGWLCTTPSLLAQYVVLNEGDAFERLSNSSGDVYYVLEGEGTTQVARDIFDWRVGDAFCAPGGKLARHMSTSRKSLLFQVSDEPLFSFLGARSNPDGERSVALTHFSGDRIGASLEEVHERRGEILSAGKCVVFVTPQMANMYLATPSLLASVNSLEPGGSQRPHKHNSVALTLAIQGENVYSIVGEEKVDWIDGAVALTPPGAEHSHHNNGSHLMRSFVVQDTGLHTHLQTVGFHWTGC